MAAQPYQFVMQTGPNPGKTFIIQKNETSIGRDETNDIFILDSGISRHHASLTLQGTNYVLRDLGSTNGTFVNDQRLAAPRALKPGDVVLLGDKVKIVLEMARYDPDVTIQRNRPGGIPAEAEPFGAARQEPAKAVPQPPRAFQPRPEPPVMRFDPRRYTAEDDRRRALVPWVAGGAGCLVILCIVGAGILWYIDANLLWCDVLPFLAGCP
jgi:hypothetical protein